MTKSFTKGQRMQDAVLRIAQPFSMQAEQAVIGALLGAPIETLHELGDFLTYSHFYDPFCKAVYQKALEMHAVGQTVDAVVLSARLEGLVEMSQDDILASLEQIFTSYPSVSNPNGWAEVIVDKYTERSLARAGDSLAEMAHAQNLTREEKLAQAHKLLAEVGTTMSTDTVVGTEQMVFDTMKMIEEFSKAGGKITGTPTGFKDLDEATSGLGAGDLVIIGARPSMGKTALCLSIAKHCCSELPIGERRGVMLFSLEMGVTQIGLRWLAARYGIPMKHMRSGRISAEDNQRLNDALEEAPDIPFFLEESGSINIEQLCAKARRKHRESPLGMIVIDYLQLVSDSGRGNASKAERVGEISRALKQLARELKVPVVALSQLSRDLEKRQDKRPIMSDLRESGAIEQDADVIMFLYRDEVYNANTQDRGIGEVIIAKQRNGALDTVRLAYDAPTTCFKELGSRMTAR